MADLTDLVAAEWMNEDPWVIFGSTWERRLRPISEVMGEVLKDADLRLDLAHERTGLPMSSFRAGRGG